MLVLEGMATWLEVRCLGMLELWNLAERGKSFLLYGGSGIKYGEYRVSAL
jgi:hypothetical protein